MIRHALAGWAAGAIGLAAASVAAQAMAQATLQIYVSTPAGGLPSYSHAPSGTDSRLHMTIAEPPPRPHQWLASPSLSPRSAQPAAYAALVAPSLRQLVDAAASAYDVPRALLLAVMHAESHFNPAARSPVGAIGLMQIMPGTGRRYGVHRQLDDPRNNIDVGARYLKDLLVLFRGNTELAVAAYNAGEGAVIKYGRRIPPYGETMRYVPIVMALYQKYGEKQPEPPVERLGRRAP